MANRWGNNGNSERLFSCAPKSLWTVNASHEIKRCLLLRRKVMTDLDSVLKSRDIIANKGPYSQSIDFPVVMYRYECWTMKKVEYWRIDAFKLWCWRRFLRVPWTARRSNQSILKEIRSNLAVQGTLKSLLQHHSSKASILRCSAFFIDQLSHPYMTTGKSIGLTRQIFVGNVISALICCESWAVKKAECWRIDVFELWCWRRLLRTPWTARRSNQS